MGPVALVTFWGQGVVAIGGEGVLALLVGSQLPQEVLGVSYAPLPIRATASLLSVAKKINQRTHHLSYLQGLSRSSSRRFFGAFWTGSLGGLFAVSCGRGDAGLMPTLAISSALIFS